MKHLSLLISMVYATLGYAQVDSAQRNTPWQFSGDLGLDISFQSGNLQSSTIVGQFSPSLENSNTQLTSFVQYMYSSYNKTVFQNDIFAELSGDLWYKRRFFPNVSGRFESTTLRAIKSRISIGPGIAWRVVKTPKSDLALINSVLYHQTNFSLTRELSFERWLYALTLRGNYQTLGDKVSFSHDIQYTPWQRQEKTNHILRAIFSVGLPITEQFAINIDADYLYESLVVRNRNNSNLTLAFGIAYAF